MKLKINKLAILLAVPASILLILLGLSPKTLAFDPFSKPCSSGIGTGNSAVCSSSSTGTNNANDNVVLRDIKAAADIVAFLAGALAVIMVIVGGFTLVTSAGNSERAAGARRRIIGALIGLAIVALAWTIARFITDNIL